MQFESTTTPGNRPTLIEVIFRRFGDFLWRIFWRNLASNPSYRPFLASAYFGGAVFTAYSVLNLFYKLNIDLSAVIRLPFLQFYSDQIVPFLSKPLILIGFKITPLYGALVALSAIGATPWANAEFRSKWRLMKHVLMKEDTGPNYDFTAVGAGMPKPPSRFSWHFFLTFPFILFSTYSLLGLLAFVSLLVFSCWFIVRDIRYLVAFILGTLLSIPEYFLAPYEKWNDGKYWGTRWFLAVFKRRRKLDEFIERGGLLSSVESLDPQHRNWNAARSAIRGGGRVLANTIWLLGFVALLQYVVL